MTPGKDDHRPLVAAGIASGKKLLQKLSHDAHTAYCRRLEQREPRKDSVQAVDDDEGPGFLDMLQQGANAAASVSATSHVASNSGCRGRKLGPQGFHQRPNVTNRAGSRSQVYAEDGVGEACLCPDLTGALEKGRFPQHPCGRGQTPCRVFGAFSPGFPRQSLCQSAQVWAGPLAQTSYLPRCCLGNYTGSLRTVKDGRVVCHGTVDGRATPVSQRQADVKHGRPGVVCPKGRPTLLRCPAKCRAIDKKVRCKSCQERVP